LVRNSILVAKPLILRKRFKDELHSSESVEEIELMDVNAARERRYNVFVEEAEDVRIISLIYAFRSILYLQEMSN
jgi:hypothetical protein